MSVPCAVLGSGNIGTDLMAKLLRSSALELTAVVGVDPASEGLARARAMGLDTSTDGVDWIVTHHDQAQIVFDATSAHVHRENAPRLAEVELRCIDLTPSRLGPGVVPVVNLDLHAGVSDLNLVSCGGQATIPIISAIASVTPVVYAEIVATIASRSAGPGTRKNIDEFTSTTAAGLVDIGGADRGKAIIVLNPAEPPLMMRNTVLCTIGDSVDEQAIAGAVDDMIERVRTYVPGYRAVTAPVFDRGQVSVFLEVEGAGDYLPPYAGNLDIMTSAAVRVGEELSGVQQGVAA